MKSYHKYENVPKHMEKYYKPLDKEELNRPIHGDDVIHRFCLVGLIICGAIGFITLMPW